MKNITSENKMWRSYWYSRRKDLIYGLKPIHLYEPQAFKGKKNLDRITHYKFYNEKFYNNKSVTIKEEIPLEWQY